MDCALSRARPEISCVPLDTDLHRCPSSAQNPEDLGFFDAPGVLAECIGGDNVLIEKPVTSQLETITCRRGWLPLRSLRIFDRDIFAEDRHTRQEGDQKPECTVQADPLGQEADDGRPCQHARVTRRGEGSNG